MEIKKEFEIYYSSSVVKKHNCFQTNFTLKIKNIVEQLPVQSPALFTKYDTQ
jgi:hypothetical protein